MACHYQRNCQLPRVNTNCLDKDKLGKNITYILLQIIELATIPVSITLILKIDTTIHYYNLP